MIRVLIAEDETLVRRGLVKLLELEAGVEVVGEAQDGDEALALAERLRPDVVLLDLRMPRRDGLGVLAALAGRERAPRCLVLTTFDDAELFLKAARAGAAGYLRKDVPLEELLAAIRAVAAGDTYLQPALTSSLLRGFEAVRPRATPVPAGGGPPLLEPLTARETDVLRLMARGLSNREIGLALDAAEGTVKIHVSSILGKLAVRDRTQAVLKSIELALL